MGILVVIAIIALVIFGVMLIVHDHHEPLL